MPRAQKPSARPSKPATAKVVAARGGASNKGTATAKAAKASARATKHKPAKAVALAESARRAAARPAVRPAAAKAAAAKGAAAGRAAPKSSPAKGGAPRPAAASRAPRTARAPISASPKSPTKATPAKAGSPAVRSKIGAAKSAPRPVAKPSPARVAAKTPSIKAFPKAPVRPIRKGPLDKFLLDQQALLRAERENYVRQAESLKAEADLLATEMEPGESDFSEEGGEGGNLSVERELDLRLSAQHREAAEEIDRALAKIEAGTYGLCEKCGQPIPRLRLKALPAAPQCVACKSGGLSRR